MCSCKDKSNKDLLFVHLDYPFSHSLILSQIEGAIKILATNFLAVQRFLHLPLFKVVLIDNESLGLTKSRNFFSHTILLVILTQFRTP